MSALGTLVDIKFEKNFVFVCNREKGRERERERERECEKVGGGGGGVVIISGTPFIHRLFFQLP